MTPVDNLLRARELLHASESSERARDLHQAYLDAGEAVLFLHAWMRDLWAEIDGKRARKD